MSRKRGSRKAAPGSSNDEARTPAAESMATFAVDRREGKTIVLVDDSGRAIDVALERLPRNARVEGAVLRVPVDAGVPRWKDAMRDRPEEQRRRALLAERVKRLEGTDQGGDVVL